MPESQRTGKPESRRVGEREVRKARKLDIQKVGSEFRLYAFTHYRIKVFAQNTYSQNEYTGLCFVKKI